MKLTDIAMNVLEAFAMDDDTTQTGAVMPPDLVAHDRAYHHGHYDPRRKCKYREDREKALQARQEHETEQDIIDRLTPENVEGEEKDIVDMLEGQVSATTGSESGSGSQWGVAKLQSLLGKMKGSVGKALVGKAIEKKQAEDIQPLLNEMASHISWTANNTPESSKQYVATMEQLAGLVKSGALNEMLGLGRIPESVKKVQFRSAELQKSKDKLSKDMDMIREKMHLASPRLAAILQKQLDGMQKSMNDLDRQMSGKSGNGNDDSAAKAEAKAKKAAEKAAKKKAVSKSKSEQSGAAPGVALDSATSLADLPADQTAVLDSNSFQSLMAALPEQRKIFALSDFHDAGVRDIDPNGFGTAIFAGDFTKHGATSHSKNIGMADAIKGGTDWLNRKFFDFCEKHNNQDIVLVAGNHDHFLGDASADNIKWPSNVKYLKDSEAIVNGMRIYGTPWCEKRKGSARTASMGSSVAQQPFEIDDATIKEKFDKIPEGLDILVVHQPPRFDGQDANGNDIGPDVAFVGGQMKHCGSQFLTDAIKRAKPKLVICGHLHDGDHRPYKIGDTVVINGAYVANRGDPAWTAHEIGVNDTNGIGFFVDGENNHQKK